MLRLKMLILSYKTGTLDTLYKVLLAEQVHNYEREYDHYCRGITNNVLIEGLTCEVLIGK